MVNVSEKMPESEEVEVWAKELNIVGTRIGARFERSEPRERAVKYIQGLMSDIPRKNGWQLAEYAGEATPDGMQRLLSTATWDVDGVCADLREYVVEEIGRPDGVLVIDETGFLKKGTILSGSNGNIAAQRVGSRIVRSEYF